MDNNRKEKLDDLYRKHAKSLYYYLYQLSGSPDLAEDLVQETFYKATISLSFYQDYEIKSWLFKVARHAYLDEWRKRNRLQWVPFMEHIHSRKEMLGPYESPEDYIKRKENENDLDYFMKQLNERYRTILYLREKEELSYQEIGTILEMNLNQVKVTLNRARSRLKELIQRNSLR